MGRGPAGPLFVIAAEPCVDARRMSSDASKLLRWLMFAVLLVVPARVVRGETVAGLPAPTGYVNDFAGVLSPETVQSLEDLCTQVDQQAHAQIAVVTVKSIDPDKIGATPTIEEFATALEDKWKVGAKGTDSGVLMILSLNPRRCMAGLRSATGWKES